MAGSLERAITQDVAFWALFGLAVVNRDKISEFFDKEAIQPEVVENDEILQKFNDQEEIIKNNPPVCRYGFNAVLIKGSYPVPSSWYCEKSRGIGF